MLASNRIKIQMRGSCFRHCSSVLNMCDRENLPLASTKAVEGELHNLDYCLTFCGYAKPPKAVWVSVSEPHTPCYMTRTK